MLRFEHTWLIFKIGTWRGNFSRIAPRFRARSNGRGFAEPGAMPLLRIALFCMFAACGSQARHARVTGRIDVGSFESTPNRVEALGDDGAYEETSLEPSGAFALAVGLENVWSLRVVTDRGAHPIALSRRGHFDRGFIAQGRAEARLGTVWLPTADTDVTRLDEREAGGCIEGRLADGSPCAVLEALSSCADGPRRPTDDPTALLLGTGALRELPGAQAGVRYAISSHVPPPILWECPDTPLP